MVICYLRESLPKSLREHNFSIYSMEKIFYYIHVACLLSSLLWNVKGAYYLKPTGKCRKTFPVEATGLKTRKMATNMSKHDWWPVKIRMNHSRLLFCTLRSIERISLGKSKASFTALRILIHQHTSRFSPRVHCYPRLLVYPLQPMNTLKNHSI